MKMKEKALPKYRVGIKINYLTILEILGKGVNRKCICKCECGTVKEFYISNIAPKKNARYTVSCGCKKSEITSAKNKTHGMSNTRFYKRWRSMFDRISPKYICAKDYKDVTICERWSKFNNFYKDMFDSYKLHKDIFGERQTTLDRVNPFGNYELSNCRWATFSEQNYNTKKHYDNNLPPKTTI